MAPTQFGMRCPNGTEGARSTVLSKEEEALIVAFRKHTLLPLDDCLYAPSGYCSYAISLAPLLPAASLSQASILGLRAPDGR